MTMNFGIFISLRQCSVSRHENGTKTSNIISERYVVFKENNKYQSSDITVLIRIYHDSIANALVKLHSSRQLVRL